METIFFKKYDEENFVDNLIEFPLRKKINFFSDMTEDQWNRATLCMNNIHKPIIPIRFKKVVLIYIFEYNFKHLSLKLNENNLNNLFS